MTEFMNVFTPIMLLGMIAFGALHLSVGLEPSFKFVRESYANLRKPKD